MEEPTAATFLQGAPRTSVAPRDVHAIWRLLKTASAFPSPELEDIARSEFGIATGDDVERLLMEATALGLTERDSRGWKETSEGRLFGFLPHWRLWRVPREVRRAVSELGLDHCFLSEELISGWPIIIDLFSGAGGLGLGFASAGFDVRVSLDNDPQACEAARENFPDSHVLEEDIQKVAPDAKRLLCKQFGLNPGDVAGIIGGPPCQGFTYIGERSAADERSLLTSRFMDVVLEIEPSFFLLENVVGLKNIGSRPPLLNFMRQLSKGIGEPAGIIAQALPKVSHPRVNRERQYRRRIVSKAVTSFHDSLRTRLMKSRVDMCKAFPEAYENLRRCMVESVRDVYVGAELKRAESLTEGMAPSVAQISIASTVRVAVDLKLISVSQCESAVRALGTDKDKPPKLRNAAKALLARYAALPTKSTYEGEVVGPVLAHLIERASTKYNVSAPKVLNAGWYGSPQDRKRVFLVGVHRRHGLEFNFPPPIFRLPGTAADGSNGALASGPTPRDAIDDLPDVDLYSELVKGSELPASDLSQAPSAFARKLRLDVLDEDDWSLPRPTWNPFVIDCSRKVVHAAHVLKRMRRTPEGGHDQKSHRKRLHREKASHTLRAGTRESEGSHTAVRPIHYEHDRVITVREGARLMGYPDWMTFHETKWHGFRLVGNGVPLQLGHAVAVAIRRFLYPRDFRPS